MNIYQVKKDICSAMKRIYPKKGCAHGATSPGHTLFRKTLRRASLIWRCSNDTIRLISVEENATLHLQLTSDLYVT